MITILAPAKTLDFDSPVPTAGSTIPAFLDDAEQIVELLRGYDAAALSELMKLSPSLSDLNAERNTRWSRQVHETDDAGRSESRQAIHAFKGGVYQGFAAEELSQDRIGFAQDHLRILSGLYGVLRPLDRIMPYRLEMATSLENPRGANLYAFWGSRIARHLKDSLVGSASPVIINLASQEYFRAVDTKHLGVPVITPVFKEQRTGGLRVIGVHAKRQRGRMARWIVENGIDRPEAIREYALDGYSYAPERSTEEEWAFLR
ncbi:MAG: peroxide stress protein YaaA [Alkalispirochaeta sp.]